MTLLEVSKKLGVSPAWINKMQREMCIRDKRQGKGVSSDYTDDDLKQFRKIVGLRTIGVSLWEIGRIVAFREIDKKKIKERLNTTITNLEEVVDMVC